MAVAAAVLPVIPNLTAEAAEGDAELLDLEAQVTRLIDEMNAGLHSMKGNITEEAIAHEDNLEAAIARHPARTLEGVAVKLRRQRYWIEEIYCQDVGFVESALADLQRLSGRLS
ncbi:MAG: hypothetical protein ACE5MH_10605 [Terriglobia bacterium]